MSWVFQTREPMGDWSDFTRFESYLAACRFAAEFEEGENVLDVRIIQRHEVTCYEFTRKACRVSA
jgi:hypothetical protein